MGVTIFELYCCLKLKLGGIFAGHIVAMVTYCTTKLTATCWSMIGQFLFFFFDELGINRYRVVIMTHQNLCLGKYRKMTHLKLYINYYLPLNHFDKMQMAKTGSLFLWMPSGHLQNLWIAATMMVYNVRQKKVIIFCINYMMENREITLLAPCRGLCLAEVSTLKTLIYICCVRIAWGPYWEKVSAWCVNRLTDGGLIFSQYNPKQTF